MAIFNSYVTLPEGIPRNTKLSNNSGLCGSKFPHSFDEVHPELNGDVPVPSSQALGSFQRVYDKKKGVK